MHFRLRSVLGASCAVLSLISPAHADDEVVVTATRAPSTPDRIADSVTVITAEEARASQKLAVSELLTTTPGLSAVRNGGLGKQTSIMIRGAESEQTVVLIDGVKLNDPSSPGGGFDFADLLVNDIARIEILRGAHSTLWGSQAIGGVVNIITPVPQGPLSAAVSGELGSYETGEVKARVEAGDERFAWRAGASYLTTDGVSAFDKDLGGHEDDGYRNLGVHGRALWYVNDAVTAELRSYWWRGRSDIDGFPAPTFVFADTREYGITRESVNYAGVNIDTFGGKLKHRIGVAYTDTDRENRDPDDSIETTFDADGSNLRWEYQATLTVNEAFTSVFGLEREKSSFSTASPSEFDPHPAPLRKDVTLDSLYALAQFSPIAPLTFTAGVRRDDHDTFGNHTTAEAGVTWGITDSTRLRASYGEGLKAPTLYQMFSQYGTPSLAAEQSDDWDAGIEQRFGNALTLSATYFERHTDNMIDFVSCFGSTAPQCVLQPFGFYENVRKTHTDGVELALAAKLTQQLQLDANYTHMKPQNETPGASFGNDLRRRPRETAYAQLAYAWPLPLTTTIAAQYVGRSFEDVANRVELHDYVLVDLRAAYAVSKQLEIYGRVENLLDEDYQTAARYGSLGRGVYAGFRMGF